MPLQAIAASQQTSVVADPISVSIGHDPTDIVMPGQPIVLHWNVADSAHQNTFIRLYREGEGWMSSTTLTDSLGHEIEVADRSAPVPRGNHSWHEINVPAGDYQSGDIVLQPNWSIETPPGDYTLRLTVRLPYSSMLPTEEASQKGVLLKVISLLIHVDAVSSSKIHDLAKILSNAIYADDYKGPYSRQAAIITLFCLPKDEVIDVWRSILLGENIPSVNAIPLIADALKAQPNMDVADRCGEMCRLGLKRIVSI
jgi:hypothetical protein